jgi:hypothetical protein
MQPPRLKNADQDTDTATPVHATPPEISFVIE